MQKCPDGSVVVRDPNNNCETFPYPKQHLLQNQLDVQKILNNVQMEQWSEQKPR